MRRLNNKGVTTIEILICFIIVVIITVSMYAVVSSYNQKRIIEGYKEKLTSYKNILTKDMQDDFVMIGVTGAVYKRETSGAKVTYTVDIDLRDGTKRKLIVEQTLGKSSYHPAGTPNTSDAFMIKYGSPTDLIEYELPDLGSYKEGSYTIQDLSINNVLIQVLDEKVLSIYIGFYHPELGTRYAINVTTPINFVFTGAEFIAENKVNYFITYNLDGGSVTGEQNPIMYDKRTPTFTLKNPTKAGYTFTGWTGSNGTEKDTSVEIIKGSSGNRSYKANWRLNECKITYNPNDGKFNKNATNTLQTCKYGQACAIRTGIGADTYYNATRSGYSTVTDKQWRKDDASQTFNQSSTYTITNFCPNIANGDQSVTLYANWNIVKYRITYELNGGTDPSNPAFYYVTTDTFTLKNPTKEGYDFTGWTGSNGTTPEKTVTIIKGSTGKRSYTANFRAHRCTINFSPNGGKFNSNASATTQTCDYQASGNCINDMWNANGGYYSATLTGYHPKSTQEWVRDDGVVFNQASGYRAIDFCPSLKTTDQTVNLKVNWQIDTYTLTYNTNGYGSCSPKTKTANYNTKWGTLCSPSQAGVEFQGWNTKADGTGSAVDANTIAKGNTTVYAKWRILTQDWNFTATDSIQTLPIPYTGTYYLEVWGAQGQAGGGTGGKGGHSWGRIRLNKGDVLYIVVGKQNGYNGGGSGKHGGGGGGGATHIATKSGLLNSLSSDTGKVLIVAGGGGGGCNEEGALTGGSGGGTNGGNGNGSDGGKGGTQTGGGQKSSSCGGTAHGSFGKGGNAVEWCSENIGGGGGGWYGGSGGAGYQNNGSGGGGSGYLKSTLTNAGMENGVQSGNGKAYVKYNP